MFLPRECQRVNSGDGIIVQWDRLDLIRDGLGSDGGQLVEGDVHGVNLQLLLSVKVVADVFNFILVDIQPVKRPWIFRFERELRFKLSTVMHQHHSARKEWYSIKRKWVEVERKSVQFFGTFGLNTRTQNPSINWTVSVAFKIVEILVEDNFINLWAEIW